MLLLSIACLQRPCDRQPWYLDEDGDGWGSGLQVRSCEQPPRGVARSRDCDDQDPNVHPERQEICDGVDQNCNGAVDDEAVDSTTWFADQDGDSWGDPLAEVQACEAPAGHVDRAEDCDDSTAQVAPDQVETCDEIDQDCDGQVDEEAIDRVERYVDADADGWGDEALGFGCLQPGESALSGDCDDQDPTTFPGAAERESTTECWTDADGDGWGPSDPDDSDPNIQPERCENGVDDDGDALVDCEDGDCVEQSVCQESCWGGIDEDLDGFTDCEDDDCWGQDDCATVWVQGGELRWDYRLLSSSVVSAQVQARHVTGQATWGSGAMACSWSVQTASMSFSWQGSSSTGGPATRTGFNATSCSMTAGALPTWFQPAGSDQPWLLPASGVDWYQGTLQSSWTTSSGWGAQLILGSGEPFSD